MKPICLQPAPHIVGEQLKQRIGCCDASCLFDRQGRQLLLFGFCLYFITTDLVIRVSHYLFLCTRHVLEDGNPKMNESPSPHLAFQELMLQRQRWAWSPGSENNRASP